MKAGVLVAPGRMEIREVAEPAPGPEEVLLEVGCVGLCGSDLNAYRGTSPMVTYPRIIGHEVGATIVAAGAAVPSEFGPGLRVTLSPYSHCGVCPACRLGRTNTCQFNQTLGVQRDGALCERFAIDYRKLFPSETLSLQELALVEPLCVGAHGVNLGQVSDADTVLVLGCGAVGLGAVAAAARRGARVIAGDIDDAKLALAAKLGAHTTVDTNTEPADRISGLTNGEGPSVVVEAVGLPQTYRFALDAVATAGRVVCIGYANDPMEIDTKLIVRKELAVLGSRNARDEFRSVVAMLEARERPFTEMISRLAPLEEAPQALAAWSAAPGRVTRILVQVGETE
jgi:threonine dehydrogenase-like Zn-dependent dehydrogenase